MAMLYYWTKECESGITELRYERRAIQNTKARFQANIAKIPTALARNSFRNLEEQMMPLHRLRLETLFTQSFYLRDMLDVMGTRKIRETTDFDWRRNPRLYYQEVEDEKMAPVIYILENKFSYGCEFYGNQVGIAMTSITERCFLTMSQALSSSHGVILQGPQAVGKTETVKGFGVLFSNFISVLHCDMNMSPHSLGKLMQGVPLDGYWVCFDEVHLMRREAMAVLLQCASTLFNALKISRETVEINGDEDSKAFLNLNILTAVLKRSVMKRKNMRGDTVDRQSTTMEKNRSETVDKKVTLEESRSNSQASGALNSAGSVISE
ncbi:hypothetical protein EB796_011605 [Bugula neritina]|uniref:Dynein heavy chain hydrolytic ATP-binding dynein motor region domain-containing protein n=1 Tax=Bugula neritina TaxID=10212 RepID=A0A7J7JUP8_BUGNE|nr:hypothetical protein EB796_011605 [Bugula neritina]